MTKRAIRLFAFTTALASATFFGAWSVSAERPTICYDEQCDGLSCSAENYFSCFRGQSSCLTECCYPGTGLCGD